LKERFEDGWMDGGKNQSIHFERKDLMDGWMDGNSIFSPCKNIIFEKSSKKKSKIFQDIITL
jgi:hypothetical protein